MISPQSEKNQAAGIFCFIHKIFERKAERKWND